ncbi:MAG: glutamine--fructose-6-phosphate transaminase (isomerizing), partial [Candidatus Kapabacteria bacterium]|nr:glutamine--fructose-6-phosphate transaminase (isomerizing) [Candidatus Kapabacteria bacterium]
MCGIVGYIGSQKASDILLNGLKRLEYRGYDSAGISYFQDGKIETVKQAGKVSELEKLLNLDEITSTIGIAHTRWATHGEPNNINAHPHFDNSGKISVIHNGIIENYAVIKQKLTEEGYKFVSETDSEVLAVYIGALYEKLNNLEDAVSTALSEVDGTFGIIVMSSDDADSLIAARRGSPMVLGIGEGEYIVASDASAIIQYTRRVIYLSENEMAIIDRKGFKTKTIFNETTTNDIHELSFNVEQIEKGGFDHFMLKEIHEQPNTFHDAFRGRLMAHQGNVMLGGLRNVTDKLRNAKRIIITACGTSWHAALTAEYMIENLAQIPVEVEYASEFRYRNSPLYPDDIVVAISQSGETADTLAAVKDAKQKGALTLGIVNGVGSSIARETDAGIYIHAGPEIGVASTKAFTSQLSAMSLFAMYLGRMHRMSQSDGKRIANALIKIPDQIQAILDKSDQIKEIAHSFADTSNCLYLGRGYNFPAALEGALKLKEISYIHAEGYPAAEMKHGPIALITKDLPVVFIATKDEIYDKVISNIQEVRARKGKVIAIATEGDEQIKNYADHVFYIPDTISMLTPVLAV